MIKQTDIYQIIAERDFYKAIINTVPAFIRTDRSNEQFIEWINDKAAVMLGIKKELIMRNSLYFNDYLADDSNLNFKPDTSSSEETDVYPCRCALKTANNCIVHFCGEQMPENDAVGDLAVRHLFVHVDMYYEMCSYQALKRQCQELTQQYYQQQISRLSKAELVVVKMVSEGKLLKEIASELHRSPNTIDKHIRHIFTKLNIHKSLQMAVWAKEVGLV